MNYDTSMDGAAEQIAALRWCESLKVKRLIDGLM